ncbi:hypothetical protein EK904_010094, partial [Melospiza melodia maxima]
MDYFEATSRRYLSQQSEFRLVCQVSRGFPNPCQQADPKECEQQGNCREHLSCKCHHTHHQCCAVAFIEKLDAQSLNLSQEDFDRFMSGQTSPKKQESDSFSPDVCLGVKQMCKSLDLLSQLNERQERIVSEAKKLEKDLIDWTDGITKEVEDIVEKYPLEIKAKSQALAAIDSENVENDKLPPPLQPQ